MNAPRAAEAGTNSAEGWSHEHRTVRTPCSRHPLTALSAIACGGAPGTQTASDQSALGEDDPEAQVCRPIQTSITGGETSITGEFNPEAEAAAGAGAPIAPIAKLASGVRPMGLLWTNVDCRCDFSGGEGNVSKTARSSYGLCGSQDSAADAKAACFRAAYGGVLNELSPSRRAYELRFHSLYTAPYAHLVESGSLGNISCQ